MKIARRLSAPLLLCCVSLGCSSADGDEQPSGNAGSAGMAGASHGGSGGGGMSGASAGSAGSGGANGLAGSAGSASNAGSAGSAGSVSNGGAGGGGDGAGIPCAEPFEAVDSELKGCIAEVSGVTMKFFPLAPGKAVKRVAVYLHGDTAVDWTGWYQFLAETVVWCQERDILVVAPLSPSKYEDDAPDEWSYGAAQYEDAEKVGKALEDFLDAYETPHQNLLYWTMSGGSWFVTSSFLPLMGARLPGSYSLSCGASDFWYDYAWDIDGPARAQNRLLFNYGTEDFLLEGEEASAEHYQQDGFSVSVKTYPGAQHCDHPMHEPTIAFWAEQ